MLVFSAARLDAGLHHLFLQGVEFLKAELRWWSSEATGVDFAMPTAMMAPSMAPNPAAPASEATITVKGLMRGGAPALAGSPAGIGAGSPP